MKNTFNKILIGTAALATVFTLTGCQKNQEAPINKTVIGDNTQIPSSWTEVETITEASKLAGYNFEAPETIDDKQITYIAVLDGEDSTTEVIYGDDITIRKASTDGDISGDYNEYKVIEIHDGEGVSFQTKGDGQVINNVTWTLGEYAYSITSSAGLSIETVNELVSIIK